MFKTLFTESFNLLSRLRIIDSLNKFSVIDLIFSINGENFNNLYQLGKCQRHSNLSQHVFEFCLINKTTIFRIIKVKSIQKLIFINLTLDHFSFYTTNKLLLPFSINWNFLTLYTTNVENINQRLNTDLWLSFANVSAQE